MPCANTIRSVLFNRLADVEKHLFDGKVENSKVSLALDCWSSPQKTAFLGILAYYIDRNWILRESLIGFEHLRGAHTGAELAKVVMDTLSRHNIQDKVHTITADNASNNETLVAGVRDFINTVPGDARILDGKIEKVPCLSHVIQLVLKALLGSIRINPTNEELRKVWNEEEELQGLADERSIGRTLAKVSL